MSTRRVFVTGASGRIGREVVRLLVARGDKVIGLSRTGAGAEAVRALGAACEVGDLTELSDGSTGALEGVQQIYHLAGGVRGAGRDTADRINRQATASLLEAVRTTAPPLDALVFSSTAAVYGDRSGLWLDEAMPVLPQTRYGQSKVDAEALLLEAAQRTGLPVRIARLAAIYGRGFPFLLVEPMQQGRAWLPGEGRNFVPTMHVSDAARALVLLGDPGAPGDIFNLADREPLSVRAFYAAVAAAHGGRPPRFWSTWVPSWAQHELAHLAERAAARLGRHPRLTPDGLRLFTASSRLRVDRLADGLGFKWTYPSPHDGIAETARSAPGAP